MSTVQPAGRPPESEDLHPVRVDRHGDGLVPAIVRVHHSIDDELPDALPRKRVDELPPDLLVREGRRGVSVEHDPHGKVWDEDERGIHDVLPPEDAPLIERPDPQERPMVDPAGMFREQHHASDGHGPIVAKETVAFEYGSDIGGIDAGWYPVDLLPMSTKRLTASSERDPWGLPLDSSIQDVRCSLAMMSLGSSCRIMCVVLPMPLQDRPS